MRREQGRSALFFGGWPRRTLLASALALALIWIAASMPSAAIAASGWSAPRALGAAGPTEADPRLAAGPRGEEFAIWISEQSGSRIVQVATRSAAGQWSAAHSISASAQGAFDPQIVVDAAGEALAAWEESTSESSAIQVASRPPGGEWSQGRAIREEAREELEPALAVNASGEAVIAWESYAYEEGVIEASMRPAGGSFQAPRPLSSSPGPEAGAPGVAIGPDGRAVAVWVSGGITAEEGGTQTMSASMRAPGGEWGAPATISQPGSFEGVPRVAIGAGEEAIAIWSGAIKGGAPMVQSAAAPSEGAFQAPQTIAAGNVEQEAQLALDPQGTAIVVWRSYEESSGGYAIRSATRAAGGAWSAPASISESSQMLGEPQISLNAQGDALAVWASRSGGVEGPVAIAAAVRPAGGSWSAAQTIAAPPASGTDEQPQAAAGPHGASAIWAAAVGAGATLEEAEYAAPGPLLSSLSIPATATTGSPVSFSVSPLALWAAPASPSWSFGDGTGAQGAAVTHLFAAPGTYTVTLTAPDVLGNLSTASATITVAAAPVTPPAPSTPPPTQTVKSAAGVAIAARAGQLRGGTVRLRVRCSGRGACHGVLKLLQRVGAAQHRHGKARHRGRGRPQRAAHASRHLPRHAARHRHAHRGRRRHRQATRTVTLGHARFSIAAGGSVVLRIRLTRRGRALFAHARHHRLRVRVSGRGVKRGTVLLREAPAHRRPARHRRRRHHHGARPRRSIIAPAAGS